MKIVFCCHTSESWYPEILKNNNWMPAYAGMTKSWAGAL